MIKAKFIKPVPTKEGITLIFQAEKNKETMRIVAELMDEECNIEKSGMTVVATPVQKFITSITPFVQGLYDDSVREGMTGSLPFQSSLEEELHQATFTGVEGGPPDPP